jgi:hypothetical protein
MPRQMPRLRHIYEDFVNDEPAPKSHSQKKRSAMHARVEDEQTSATPIELPSASEGWQLTRPDNPELYVSAMRTVRMSDGEVLKLFKVLIRPEVLKAKRKAVKKLKKRIEREDAAAEAAAAKRRVKLTLALLGKRLR